MDNAGQPVNSSYSLGSSSAGSKVGIKDTSAPTVRDTSGKRFIVGSTEPTGGISNVSQEDNGPINMNCPSTKPRGFRADQLLEMAGMDGYSLTAEAPRRTKMKG